MLRYLTSLFVCALIVLFAGCDANKNDGDPNNVTVTGMVTVESNDTVNGTFEALEEALETNKNIGIVATVDHASNAQNAGLTLRATQVILFGNPQLGTPLMQQNQTTGIDLPQKFLVYQDANNEVRVGYNHPQYVANRHGITGEDEVLNTISNALSNFAENEAGNPADQESLSNSVGEGEGLVTIQSENSVDSTYQNLVQAIEDNEELSILAELDHQANAATAGLDLRPTKLLVFGNPNLGTPLMQSSQTIAIDLPQKFLVYEDAEGQVFVVYNDPFYLAERHKLEGTQEQLDQISGALKKLTEAATS